MAQRHEGDAVCLPPRARGRMRFAFGLLAAALALHIAHATLKFGGSLTDRLINDVDYDLMLVGSAVACLARAVLVARERRGRWVFFSQPPSTGPGDDSSSALHSGPKEPPTPAPWYSL